ncbi:MAG: hypothetical protein KF871_00680 [Hydrogenophaga sp.]|uniref:hypothetical protein n=1 Tax=Hydrogenophaga sp. TaxID=1904254 RepID=UPI001DC344B1|nr:hypothetical protein [Hydrogenophaga sp.]MBX3608381.1 hypothetical protein [Hydrogenophaga sp.]
MSTMTATTQAPNADESSPSEAPEGCAQWVFDPFRRWHMATSAGPWLVEPIRQTMTQVFLATQDISDLASQMEAVGAPVHAKGLLDVHTMARALRETQTRLDDALLACDRLGELVQHLTNLMSLTPQRARACDLRQLLTQALYVARSLMPQEWQVSHHFGELPPVFGEPTELGHALLDMLLQLGRTQATPPLLTIEGGSQDGLVRLALRAEHATNAQAIGPALASAMETVARYRGTLTVHDVDDALVLSLCLPATA